MNARQRGGLGLLLLAIVGAAVALALVAPAAVGRFVGNLWLTVMGAVMGLLGGLLG